MKNYALTIFILYKMVKNLLLYFRLFRPLKPFKSILWQLLES